MNKAEYETINAIRNKAESIYLNTRWYNATMAVATKGQWDFNTFDGALPNPDIIIAENRIQEAEGKWDVISQFPNPKHFIGTLQKNKVRKAVKLFDSIETVDSLDLFRRIDRIAKEEEKTVKVLFSVNISEDENKSGMNIKELGECILDIIQNPPTHTIIAGLFTILQNHLTETERRGYYKMMKQIKEHFQGYLGTKHFKELSMGMSEDYGIALEEGATIVRVGRGIFGGLE